MNFTFLGIFSTAALAMLYPAAAIAAPTQVVIGDIDDLSGMYSDLSGPGAAEAMKMAVADFGGVVLGRKIVTLVADHQNNLTSGHRSSVSGSIKTASTCFWAGRIPASALQSQKSQRLRKCRSSRSARAEPR
jgi:hypothetical protein